MEVCTPTGVMLVAGYADHSAQVLHSTGNGVIWDYPDHSLDEKIDMFLMAAEEAVTSVPLTRVDTAPISPDQPDTILICIFTPSGIYQGLGTGDYLWQDKYARPVVGIATELLETLQEKNRDSKQ